MPFGIPASAGGESAANVAKMERCVASVMKKGNSEESAIRICKVQLGFTKRSEVMDEVQSHYTFRAAVLDDPQQLAKALEDGATIGEARLRVAVFGVPDNGVAVGNIMPWVIDHGSYAGWITSRDFERDPVPMFVDHGDAHQTGVYSARLKIGKTDSYAEEADGLTHRALYNLQKQVAREAFSDLLFDPYGTQFSMGQYEDRTEGTKRDDQGFGHVTKVNDLYEVSQTGFGAQRLAGAFPETFAMRADLRGHSTAVVDHGWDPAEHEKRLPDDELKLRMMYAWKEPEGSGREAWRLPHHEVGEDGMVGAANVAACRSMIQALNETTPVPDDDRMPVYEHAAQHLRDAGQDVPALRAVRIPTKDELSEWMEKVPEFGATMRELAGGTAQPILDIDDLTAELRGDRVKRDRLKTILEELDRPPAAQQFLRSVWNARKRESAAG